MSHLKFLIGSNASSISLHSFDPTTKSISLIKDNTVVKTPSWVEKSRSISGVFYSLSEEGGKALSLKVDLKTGEVETTATVGTFGNPAHVHAMKDGSGVVTTNYMGGSAIYIPVEPSTGVLAPSQNPTISTILSTITPVSASSLVAPNHLFKFISPYGSSPGPNAERQEASHPHQCIEGEDGLLFVPDLGSDRVWMLRKGEGETLKLVGQLNMPGGAGPRHAAVSAGNKYLYVLAELTHSLYIFKVPADSATATQPLNVDSPTCIVPSSVPASKRPSMTAGELLLSPTSPRTLYASNRGQVDPDDGADMSPADKVKGDAIAIITLSSAGDKVENIDIVQTGANFIRGMAVTPDGKYLGIVGQKGNEIEVYECTGEHGEKLELVARSEGQTELGTDFVWV